MCVRFHRLLWTCIRLGRAKDLAKRQVRDHTDQSERTETHSLTLPRLYVIPTATEVKKSKTEARKEDPLFIERNLFFKGMAARER